MHLGFTPHPIAALVVAVLLTIWLGIFYYMPLPAGPDRAMIGLGCVFLQTPRWLAMALVLGVCVARGYPHTEAHQRAPVKQSCNVRTLAFYEDTMPKFIDELDLRRSADTPSIPTWDGSSFRSGTRSIDRGAEISPDGNRRTFLQPRDSND